MSRSYVLIPLGILVALSPYVGVPYSYLMWALPVLGLIILLVGVSPQKKHPAETEVHETNLET